MKYIAKANVTALNKDGSVAGEYKQGQEYDEKDIVDGVDMNDFASVDKTDVAEVSDEDEEKEMPNLSKMTRDEVDNYATEHTNLDPADYSTKDELIEAIEEAA